MGVATKFNLFEILLLLAVSLTIVRQYSIVSGCASSRCLSSPPKSLRKRTLLFHKYLKSNSKGQRESVGLHEKG